MLTRKSEIRQKIRQMLSDGASKQALYDRFRGMAFNDRQLATILAATPQADLVEQSRWRVWGMRLISFIQVLIGLVVGWHAGAQFGEAGMWVSAVGLALIPALMLWGFFRNSIHAYNTYILVQALQVAPQVTMLLEGWGETLAGWTALSLTLLLVAYAVTLRFRLFPVMGVFSARAGKDGQYAFT